MVHNAILPRALNDSLGSEPKDFAVKAGADRPMFQSLGLLLFGLFWTVFTCVFIVILLGPLLLGKETQFEMNDVPVVASPNHLAPVILPAIFLGIFLLVGILLLVHAISSLRKQGAYFVSTPSRLIHYRKGKIRSIHWKAFSGEVVLRGGKDRGTLILSMRRGERTWRKTRISMIRIPGAPEIEKICRQRIRENDPDLPGS